MVSCLGFRARARAQGYHLCGAVLSRVRTLSGYAIGFFYDI